MPLISWVLWSKEVWSTIPGRNRPVKINLVWVLSLFQCHWQQILFFFFFLMYIYMYINMRTQFYYLSQMRFPVKLHHSQVKCSYQWHKELESSSFTEVLLLTVCTQWMGLVSFQVDLTRWGRVGLRVGLFIAKSESRDSIMCTDQLKRRCVKSARSWKARLPFHTIHILQLLQIVE